jgi:hypothetical protein
MNMLWTCLGLHLLADYFLQGCLSDLKRKRWWSDQIKKLYKDYDGYSKSFEWQYRFIKKYKYDYMAGLLCHAAMWTIVSFFPLMWFCAPGMFTMLVLANILVHFVTDHMKANAQRLNLIQDQLIHLVQVIITVLIVML